MVPTVIIKSPVFLRKPLYFFILDQAAPTHLVSMIFLPNTQLHTRLWIFLSFSRYLSSWSLINYFIMCVTLFARYSVDFFCALTAEVVQENSIFFQFCPQLEQRFFNHSLATSPSIHALLCQYTSTLLS